MSKRDLKKYLATLDKAQVEDQILELYDKFKEVKTYYDFVFNPREEKLIQEAKQKILHEYFPIKGKRPKLRRSVSQKYIKHFLVLGVDPIALADLMLYAIETAQRYSAKREMKYASFYKSIENAFEQLIKFAIENGLVPEYMSRIEAITAESLKQHWENAHRFEDRLDMLKCELW